MTRLPETWSETRRLGVVRIISKAIEQKKSHDQILDLFVNSNSRANLLHDLSSNYFEKIRDRKIRRVFETGLPGSTSVFQNYLRLMKGMALIDYDLKENFDPLPNLFLLTCFDNMYSPEQRRSVFELVSLERLFFSRLLLKKDKDLFIPSMIAIDGSQWPWNRIEFERYGEFCKSAADMLQSSLFNVKAEERFSIRRQIDYLRSCAIEITRVHKIRAGIKHILIPRIHWMLDMQFFDFSRRGVKLNQEWRVLMDKSTEKPNELNGEIDTALRMHGNKSAKPSSLQEHETYDDLIRFCIKIFSKYFVRLVPLEQLSDLVYLSLMLLGSPHNRNAIKNSILSLPSVRSYRGMYGGIKFIEYHKKLESDS